MPTLRRELTFFVLAADELIASMTKTELSETERAIVEFYIQEIPAKYPMRPV